MIKKTSQNRWQARVSYKDLDNNYKTKTKSFSTKGEAQSWERQIHQSIEDGSFFEENNTTTFASYFEDWCRTYKMKNVSISTQNKYEYDIKLVHEFFKHKELKDVTRKDYQKFIDQRGKNNGRDVVEKTHHRIKGCMADALHDGLIDKDPTWRAVINYDNKPNPRLKYWNAEDLTKLIQYFSQQNHQIDTLFYLLATTGMRIGEAYGLSWEDIDNQSITINRGYNHSYKRFTGGKNKSSLRSILIDGSTVKLLNQYKLKHRKSCPEYLFLHSVKDPVLTYTAATQHLKSVCKTLGINYLPPHAFRHSHCCYLIYQHVDINYIANRLGHSSVIETQKTYSHIIKEMENIESDKTLKAISLLTNQNS